MSEWSLTRLLAINASTAFVLSETGRILSQNDPDRSPGPRLFFAGCAGGNHTHVHQRVPTDTAMRVLELLADEPPWLNPDLPPLALPAVKELLQRDTPVVSVERSVIYLLPRPTTGDLQFICSGTEEGAQLLAELHLTGLPKHLVAARFNSLADFWAPWCALIDGQTIASLAFAARLGNQGAEITFILSRAGAHEALLRLRLTDGHHSPISLAWSCFTPLRATIEVLGGWPNGWGSSALRYG